MKNLNSEWLLKVAGEFLSDSFLQVEVFIVNFSSFLKSPIAMER